MWLDCLNLFLFNLFFFTFALSANFFVLNKISLSVGSSRDFFSIFLLFRAKNTGKLFSLYFLGVSRRDKIFVESEQSTITSDWFKDFRRNDAMRGVVSCRIILSVHTVRESRELQSSPLQLTATCLLLRRQRGLHYPHSHRASTKHRKHPTRCLHVER